MVLYGGGLVEEAVGAFQRNEVNGCVSGWYYIVPYQFANIEPFTH